MIYQGSCHCASVRFEFEGEEVLDCVECNCSICSKSGYIHYFVERDALDIRGMEHLHTYTFNTGVAKHYFCSRCGIKPFYVPRSHPDGYSVNIRCLNPIPSSIKLSHFDGQHWEENIQSL